MKNRMVRVGVCAALCLSAMMAMSQTRRGAKSEQNPYEIVQETERIQAKDFAPKKRAPVYTGAFSVGLVLIRFPDTVEIKLDDVKERFGRTGGYTLEEYFKDYSQGITWPQMMVVGEEAFPKCVFMAPEPLGYYCRHDTWSNPLGYGNDDEGRSRAAALKQAARAHAFKSHKRRSDIPLKGDGTPHVVAYVYEKRRIPRDEFKSLIRPRYPAGMMITYDRSREAWELYSPPIEWSDPLWPNSSVQVFNEGDGGTLCHELGHVLGAPDFYHATEPHDGVGGNPSLTWAFGPTGPGYCRAIYQAFLPPSAYPMVTKEGEYTLHPRKTNPAEDKALGMLVPSIHPHYLFCFEYVKDERSPLGNSDAQGLLVQVINVTLPGPFMGPPDLCYAYRKGDPWFRGEGNAQDALFSERHGRPAFNMKSDPSARLPNLMESGIALENIKENSDGTVSFTLKHTRPEITATELRESLLPKIELCEVKDVLPTSLYAKAEVLFRGEPLNVEYGFCCDIIPLPTYKKDKAFPLYHRDRYEGRILGLRPNTTYNVRAYIRSERGISYSETVKTVKTPPLKPLPDAVPALLTDRFSGNWVIERFHSGRMNDAHKVGSCALTGMLKLMAYYRAPMDPATRIPEFDYTRIHMNPSLSRPKFRMAEFDRATGIANGLADKAKLREQTFPKDFDRNIRNVFKLRPKPGEPCVEVLDVGTMDKLTPVIQAQLADGKPVMVVQESVQPMSPQEYALMMVLIDGYNADGAFHLVYPSGEDRSLKRKSGWHPLKVLWEECNEVRVVFGLDAPSMRKAGP